MLKKIISSSVLAIALITGSLSSMNTRINDTSIMEIKKPFISYPKSMGDVKLIHDGAGFMIEHNGVAKEVQACFVDGSIRNLDNDMLSFFLGIKKLVRIRGEEFVFEVTNAASMVINPENVKYSIILSEEESSELINMLSHSNYIQISELSDGNYALHAKMRLPGGGFLGTIAGCFIGKAVVSLVGHGGIAIIGFGVSLVGTPVAGTATVIALESWLGAGIEALSLKGALIGGLAGGTLTGPI